MPTADELLGPGVLTSLIDVLESVRPGHPFSALRACAGSLPALSLRERSDLLKDAILVDLPGTAAELDGVIHTALKSPRFTGWMIWPVSEAVSTRALEAGRRVEARSGVEEGAGSTTGANTSFDEDPGSAFDAALALLAELTPRLTAEFAIRPLLRADLPRALPHVQAWTAHPDEHVRRLASEGTRAFLPWATRVPGLLERPESTVPIIHALYRDESEYVRRSVANHLNDLSRQNPDLAASIAAEWMLAADANTARLVKHGLRSLVKKGHPATLALFGFDPGHGVSVSGPALGAYTVAVGDELPFSVRLQNPTAKPARLVIDYVVHHRKANGTQTAKVFKLTTMVLQPGASVELSRRHSFKRITTRVYHPGVHSIEVQLNGKASGRVDFELAPERAGK
ncbi:DNA alkylation repair protein [Subtercola frigoramans]|uniref:3-methyladenine DNA glycosylase AlkC n=1 Tax=Subtercola frigoramans TaxID=120298 RepID=A0ABS2L125_9MICO|nr:DNA alkylation repair protein [Subtercola frigoramans]MBM7470465.1 3-methyladenine DNA glycosylase AlkC [Subtercola frigoramans]